MSEDITFLLRTSARTTADEKNDGEISINIFLAPDKLISASEKVIRSERDYFLQRKTPK